MDPLLFVIAAVLAVGYLVLWIVLREPAIEPAVVRALRHEDTIVLDVRDRRAYLEDHYPGAINIPLLELRARSPELGDRKRHVIVYCDSGMCSSRATRILREAGYEHVVDARKMDGLPSPTTDAAAALWTERRPT